MGQLKVRPQSSPAAAPGSAWRPRSDSRPRARTCSSPEGHTDAVPDFTWRVKDLAIDGDRVAARLFNRGTPAKEWFGVPPTGVTVEYAEYAFHKARDGRFYEMNCLIDAQAVQRQLAA